MNGFLTKYASKFFIQQWIVGATQCRMEDIIRTKTFNPSINWFRVKQTDKLYADPFLYKTSDGKYCIFFEDYSYNEGYGKISVMNLDKELKPVNGHEVILNTQSHLSYPFIFSENGKTYVFPEAASSGKLTCYEYDPAGKSLVFSREIMELPLLDSTILKYNNKYWLFGTMKGKDADNKLYIFYADTLLGPYTAHAGNPVKTGLTASRPAGNIVEVDGVLYRPSQNSQYTYGGSITLNKINRLSEQDFSEEFYMTVCIDKKNKSNKGMHGMHTINQVDDIMVVDGTRWRFSPAIKLKQFAMKWREKRNSNGS